MARTRGFTLIEMMVTVVIIAIVAAVAYPSYSDYVTRGKIGEATAGLQEARVRMEQFYLDNRTFLNGAACGATLPTSRYFTFTCAATATTYTVTATGVAAQGMSGFTYLIDQTNGQRTSAVPNAAWGSAPVGCWIIRKGGLCS